MCVTFAFVVVYIIYIFEFYFVWAIAFLSVWLQDLDFLFISVLIAFRDNVYWQLCHIDFQCAAFISFFLSSFVASTKEIHQICGIGYLFEKLMLWFFLFFFLVDAACFQICTSSKFVVETACDTQITVRRLICMCIPVWWSWTIFSIVWTPEREKNFVLNASCSEFFLLVLIDDLWKSRGLHSVSACGCSTE